MGFKGGCEAGFSERGEHGWLQRWLQMWLQSQNEARLSPDWLQKMASRKASVIKCGLIGAPAGEAPRVVMISLHLPDALLSRPSMGLAPQSALEDAKAGRFNQNSQPGLKMIRLSLANRWLFGSRKTGGRRANNSIFFERCAKKKSVI